MNKGNKIVLWGGVATLGVVTIAIMLNREHKAKVQKVIEDLIASGKNASLGQTSALDTNYWKTSGDTLIPVEQAQAYAIQIHDDYGYWGSNDADIASVIRSLSNQAQVSQVAYYFKSLYQQDFLSFLQDAMDRSVSNKISQITFGLISGGSSTNFNAVKDYIMSLS